MHQNVPFTDHRTFAAMRKMGVIRSIRSDIKTKTEKNKEITIAAY